MEEEGEEEEEEGEEGEEEQEEEEDEGEEEEEEEEAEDYCRFNVGRVLVLNNPPTQLARIRLSIVMPPTRNPTSG